jgi:hypothetical protein
VDGTIVFIVIGVMLVVGTIAAVIWWHMADVLFPGTARKTGQRILGGRDKGPPAVPPGATVVKGFDEPPPDKT